MAVLMEEPAAEIETNEEIDHVAEARKLFDELESLDKFIRNPSGVRVGYQHNISSEKAESMMLIGCRVRRRELVKAIKGVMDMIDDPRE